MTLGYDSYQMIGVFLAGLFGAAISLRLLLRWRFAIHLSRARSIVRRMKEAPSSLAAVEERSTAMDELVDFSDPRAAAYTVQELLDDPDAITRSAAIEVLRQTRALEMWRRDLRRGSFQIKLAAIEALGRVGDERAIDELLEVLGDDDPDVSRAAARAIAAWDVDYACERLSDALASPNRRLAETAAAALVQLEEEAVECLIAQLTNLSSQARRLAAESLGSIGGEALKQVLLPLLATEPVAEVRAALAAALARVDAASAAPEIQRLAHSDPDWFVRARAYALLAEMGAEGAVPYLLEGLALYEPDLPAFSENGHDVEAFTVGTRRVRRAIIAGLRLLGFSEDEVHSADHNGAPALTPQQLEEAAEAVGMLRHRDPAFRMEAARMLAEIGTPAAAALASSLADPDPLVRSETAQALGRIGSRDSLQPLAECLKDPDAGVRLAATTALRAVVTREAARELTE
jgi:HEAT repeat protein